MGAADAKLKSRFAWHCFVFTHLFFGHLSSLEIWAKTDNMEALESVKYHAVMSFTCYYTNHTIVHGTSTCSNKKKLLETSSLRQINWIFFW